MNKNKKPVGKYRLTNLNVRHVSLVKGDDTVPAVPGATIEVVKSLHENEFPWAMGFEILKVDEIEGRVYGRALIPETADWQGDVVSDDDVRKAAYSFMYNLVKQLQDGDGSAVNHEVLKDVGYPIETWVDTTGALQKSFLELSDDDIVKGSWVVGFQLTNDELKKDAASGDLKGFSIGGTGYRMPLGKQDQTLVGKVRALVGLGKADGDAQSFDEVEDDSNKRSEVWDKIYALEQSIISIIEDDAIEDKKAKIDESVAQFRDAIVSVISKITQLKKNTSADDAAEAQKGEDSMSDVTRKEFDELRGGVSKITEFIETMKTEASKTQSADELRNQVQKAMTIDVKNGDEVEKMTVADSFNLLAGAVTSIGATVEAMSKAVTGSRQTEESVGKTDGAEPVKKSALDGTLFDVSVIGKMANSAS